MYTYEDLKNAPVGTKISFEKGDVLVCVSKDEKYKNYCWQSGGVVRGNEDLINMKDNYNDCRLGKIIKIEEPNYVTVYEVEKEILDEKEREYLSNVIKPFKNRIISITKLKRCNKLSEFISILYEEKDMNYHIILPDFEYDAMYRGMKLNKEYSLEELRL